jgi:hypothetical protein
MVVLTVVLLPPLQDEPVMPLLPPVVLLEEDELLLEEDELLLEEDELLLEDEVELPLVVGA